jgi:chromosome partitioning protein
VVDRVGDRHIEEEQHARDHDPGVERAPRRRDVSHDGKADQTADRGHRNGSRLASGGEHQQHEQCRRAEHAGEPERGVPCLLPTRPEEPVAHSPIVRAVRLRGKNALVPGRLYALANQKGGVGKTTTAVNLAACLAEAGAATVVVDLDPQANATSGLGETPGPPSSYDLLDGAAFGDVVRATRFPNLFLVPSQPELAGAAVELSQRADGERYLADAIADVRSEFEFAFLDCPPSLGPLTVNALAAADEVLVPVQAEYYALEGLAQLTKSIELVRARLNPRLRIGGILLTMVDGRTRLSAEVAAEVRKHFGELVFAVQVPRSVRLAEAPSHGLPAIAFDRSSTGADAYWRAAGELLDRRRSAREAA